MRRAAAVSLIVVAGLLATGSGATAAQERPQAVAVGRIVIIDVYDSFVIAEFPEGRRLISVDMRELAYYSNGDEIRIDQIGRPLPPRAPR